jgi:hypothetical protein
MLSTSFALVPRQYGTGDKANGNSDIHKAWSNPIRPTGEISKHHITSPAISFLANATPTVILEKTH